jgi:hypothetical protein
MSNTEENQQNNTNVQVTNTTDEGNTTKRVQEIQKALLKIDQTKGQQAQDLYNLYGSLVSAPNADTNPTIEGKTAAQIMEEFEKVSAEVGNDKAKLEAELNELLHPVSQTQAERQEILQKRLKMANAAAQEKPKDLTKFSNPELDAIRKQLQNTTLKGGEKAAIDDGTGGEGRKASGPNLVDGNKKQKA